VPAIPGRLRDPLRWGALSPRRRLLVAVLTLAIAAAAAAGIVAALSGGGPPVPAADQNRPGEVLLVPGYGGSTAALDGLAGRIRAAGRTATVVQLAGDGTGDLQVQANVLNGYVNQALGSGSGPVTVIGYSAGGVVAWLWDVDYDGVAKARSIITLGSPLHGANLAAVGVANLPGECPQACQELVPGSAMLARLQQTSPATRPPWLSLWTTDDQVVQPPDSARLPAAVNVPLQTICPGVTIGHGQLPTAPLVVGIVLRTLTSARLAAPSPSDCRALQALGDSG
jgi:triacylglycerol esterase/lipase EstA (alpha/beta hydrolase family)